MGDLKKLKTIGGVVNNILPLVYDESLSYYEVICKILELINDANIDGMKEDIEYIKNLLENIDIEELESIINNLFNEDTPNMDGAGSAGVSNSASRSDHVHPSDTSKANKDLGINGGSVNQYVKILTVDSNGKPTSFGSDTLSDVELSDSNPVMDGTASAGSGNKASRNDHVHPSDTSKANKDLDISGGSANQYVKILTVDSDGKPTSFGSDTPSGGVELSDSNPVMDSTASAGSGTKASRSDHVHPSDTSKLGTSGDGSNVTTDFTVASSRSNIATGEKLSVLFGKIAKWFTDLGTAAFRAATSSVTSGSSDLVESGAVFTELNDKAENNEIGVVITGARPSMTVTTGQYVIVRNSTINNITDGLYVNSSNGELSPSTDVTAADLTPVSIGGLNDLRKSIYVTASDTHEMTPVQGAANGYAKWVRFGNLILYYANFYMEAYSSTDVANQKPLFTGNIQNWCYFNGATVNGQALKFVGINNTIASETVLSTADWVVISGIWPAY